MTKITTFDMLAPGDRFQMTDWTERGKPVETVYRKTSVRKAVVAENPGLEFAVKRTSRVTIEIR